ncbi:MAG: transpeptidase family protein [Bacteroidales bacterium]|nr:transpeptidase family protein [Bacteroidales bacterium]
MKEKKNRKPSGIGLLYLLLTITTVVAVVYGIINIQVVHGDTWREKGAPREKGLQVEKAHRGNIMSSDGKILATTIPQCDLYFDLGRWTQRDKNGNIVCDSTGKPVIQSLIADSNYTKYIDQVCALLQEAAPQRPAGYFKDRITTERSKDKPSRCFLVQRGIPYSYWERITQFQGWNRLVVKRVDDHSVIKDVRAHTYGNLCENTIGFRNSWESETYTGLEGYYNKQLSGKDGMFLCRRLTKGVWLPIDEGSTLDYDPDSIRIDSTMVKPVIDGKQIVSTIDTRYQDVAESALRAALTNYGGEAGCAILMETHTGYVLACSNLSKDTATHTYREMPNRNVAVSDIYEPGSTFKTVVLTAMMNDTSVHIDTAMRLRVRNKVFPYKDCEIKDDHDVNNRDTLSLRDVIAYSSNVGMSELGWIYYRNRRNDLRQQVEKIFPYNILNLDVTAGEYKGHINNLNTSWRDFLNFCYGYANNVSAMQLITFYNAIGAGGKMVKPLFCKEIIDKGKRYSIEPVVLNEAICSKETALVIKDLLQGVVEYGTGNNIRNNTYGIAGKTGTAWHSYGNTRRFNASFAGFFPADNPRYTCLVVLKDVAYYGRQAATVFKSISDCVMALDRSMGNIKLQDGQLKLDHGRWILDSFNHTAAVPSPVRKAQIKNLMLAYNSLHLPFVSTDSSGEWCVATTERDSLPKQYLYKDYSLQQGTVPDCTGMTVRDAIRLLNECGYRARFSGVGRVSSQQPKPRSKQRTGSTVVLELK